MIHEKALEAARHILATGPSGKVRPRSEDAGYTVYECHARLCAEAVLSETGDIPKNLAERLKLMERIVKGCGGQSTRQIVMYTMDILRSQRPNAAPQVSGSKQMPAPKPRTGDRPAVAAPRRQGKYRLVYNKVTKQIDKVSNVDGLVAESFDPPEDCA